MENMKQIELEAIDKLIQAVAYFGEVFCWTDSEIITTLCDDFDIKENEFIECGYEDYIKEYKDYFA